MSLQTQISRILPLHREEPKSVASPHRQPSFLEAYERMPPAWGAVPVARHKGVGTRSYWVAALQSVRNLDEYCNQVPSTHLGREFGRSASPVRMQNLARLLQNNR